MISSRLAGKVAIVTGTGSGIGQGCALWVTGTDLSIDGGATAW